MLEISLIYQYVMVANNMASFLLRNVAMEKDGEAGCVEFDKYNESQESRN